PPSSLAPETTSTRPSAIMIAEGYQRPKVMSGTRCQPPTGSIVYAALLPMKGLVSVGYSFVPPTTSNRPSHNGVSPLQKTSVAGAFGGSRTSRVVGFQIRVA